jgi:hypothetical protein
MVIGRWTRLRKEIGLSHVRLHDLRHFVVIYGGSLGHRYVRAA